MSGIISLEKLLEKMSPQLAKGEFVFCTVNGDYAEYEHLHPIACFREPEGLTLILPVASADAAQVDYESMYKQITLSVHSSLNAVGLTAAVATKLASYGISANVVAAYYHDHIFVKEEKADEAMLHLLELSRVGS